MRKFLVAFVIISCTNAKPKKTENTTKVEPDFYFVGSVYMMGKRAGWEEIRAYKYGEGYRF